MVVAQITDTLKQPKGLICFKDTYSAAMWAMRRKGIYRIIDARETVRKEKK